MASKEMRPVWYLPGPFYQYNEDVKALAKAAGLRIIDANVTEGRQEAADPDALPVVTLRDGTAPAPAKAPAPVKLATVAAAPGMIDVAPGVQISQADLDAKALELSGLTPGKFKQLPKAAREAHVVNALETAKAVEAARNLGK